MRYGFRVRLNAYLASAGVASRRRAEELIRAGRVCVNGEPAQLATRVRDSDVVELDGREVLPQPRTYALLNKPAGVVTTARDPQGRPTVVELVGQGTRLFPVGRLDCDTTGALLLTNDGMLANRLAHPRYGVEKVYEATLAGEPDARALERLRAGVELADGMTAPAKARVLHGDGRSTVVEITLREGRKRQVKRMCRAIGFPVEALHRSRYASIVLRELPVGAWRELTAAELASLRSAAAQRLLAADRSGA
ncbi:MAG: pseudouridine synthase [Actinomycetia bacterium]|nr:pseudouridine synthase [Actinomycetes bacterium]